MFVVCAVVLGLCCFVDLKLLFCGFEVVAVIVVVVVVDRGENGPAAVDTCEVRRGAVSSRCCLDKTSQYN